MCAIAWNAKGRWPSLVARASRGRQPAARSGGTSPHTRSSRRAVPRVITSFVADPQVDGRGARRCLSRGHSGSYFGREADSPCFSSAAEAPTPVGSIWALRAAPASFGRYANGLADAWSVTLGDQASRRLDTRAALALSSGTGDPGARLLLLSRLLFGLGRLASGLEVRLRPAASWLAFTLSALGPDWLSLCRSSYGAARATGRAVSGLPGLAAHRVCAADDGQLARPDRLSACGADG